MDLQMRKELKEKDRSNFRENRGQMRPFKGGVKG
jgi:hypothetical protein